jgi:hypothetical protein
MAAVPPPLDSSPLSPQRKTAPCARPARRKDDCRSGRSPGSRVSTLLHLPGPCCASPSGNLKKDSPLTVAGAAPALTRRRNGGSHRIPFPPIKRDRRTRTFAWKKPTRLLSTSEIHFQVRCDIWVSIAGQDCSARPAHAHGRWQVSKHAGRECPGCGKLMPKPLVQQFRTRLPPAGAD